MSSDFWEHQATECFKLLKWSMNGYSKLLRDYDEMLKMYELQKKELEYYKEKYGEKESK